jgi:hypothetical protein
VSLHLVLAMADFGISILISLAISAAMAGASYALSKSKRAKKPHANQPDLPVSTTATQGAQVPLLIGRRRIGALVAWVGARKAVPVVARVKSGPLKGNSSKKRATGEINYFESRWDLLCVGPAKCLRRIWQDGRVVFSAVHLAAGGLTPEEYPSGTLIQGGGNGDFYIFWGETDQEVNAHVQGHTGVASRWPHVCSVFWIDKPLGSVPRWPQLDYDMEAGPRRAPLAGCYDDLFEVGGTPEAVIDLYSGASHDPPTGDFDSTPNGSNGYEAEFTEATGAWYSALIDEPSDLGYHGYVHFFGQDTPTYGEQLSAVRVWFEDSSGFEVVLLDEEELVTVDDPPGPACWEFVEPGWVRRRFQFPYVWVPAGTWKLRVGGTIVGNPPSGWSVDVGAGIHRIPDAVLPVNDFDSVVRQLLFEPFPHGAGFDESHFDLASLASVSAALTAEGLTEFAVFAQDGDELGNVLGNLLQDAGVFWTRDPATGLETFRIVREEVDPLPTLDDDQVLPVEAEIEAVHAERAVDRAMYAFVDAARQFRDTVVGIDDDGQPTETGNVRGTVGRISSVVTFAAAAIVAERRSQQELAAPSRVVVYAGRDARMLVPGQAIRVPGISYVLRVADVEVDVLTSRAKLELFPDHYGAPVSSFAHAEDSEVIDGAADAVAANLHEDWIEIPEMVAGSGTLMIAGMRVRAHDQIVQQGVHLSDDGSTYKEVVPDGALMAGGALTEGLSATAAWEIEDGPTFDLEGPDADEVQDLTGNDARWRRGDQMCLIGSEIFFLRGIEALGGASYRLKGLIRARFDTDRELHAIGDSVFVFQEGGLLPQTDALLFPGQVLHVKQQPSTPASELSLASVAAVSRTLYGKGLRPPKPVGLRVTAPVLGSASYRTGEDVSFRWASRLANPPSTGAGSFPAGAAVGLGVVGLTDFRIRVYDSGDVLVRTEMRSVPEWTYSNADLQSDLGGEADFRIEVDEIRSGFYSDTTELAVELL